MKAKWLLLLVEAFFIWELAGVISQGGWQFSNTTLWATVILETALAILIYVLLNISITKGLQSAKKRGFTALQTLIFILLFVGVVGPIIANSIDIKWLNSTSTGYFLFVINSITLLDIIIKPKDNLWTRTNALMIHDRSLSSDFEKTERNRLFNFIRVLQYLLLGLIVIAILTLTPLSSLRNPKDVMGNDQTLTILFYLIGLTDLFFCYKWKRFSKWFTWGMSIYGSLSPSQEAANFYISRSITIAMVAFLTFLLGVFGEPWLVFLPLFVFSGLGILLTFPTKTRWDQLILEKTKSSR